MAKNRLASEASTAGLFRQSGFTLLEFVIVIILLGILSAAAYLKWPGNVMNLSGQANQLAEDLSYAQTLAMTTGQRVRLVKSSSTSYQILNSAGTAVRMPSGATSITLNRNITFGTLTNLPNSLINFDGRGTPYTDTATPGTALAATAVFTLSAGSESTTVSVTPQTGWVTVP